jgi:uncharacterized protein YyaL (SSP411 family)
MHRLALISFALLIATLPLRAERRRPVTPLPPEPVSDTRFVDAAREAGAWLTSLEIRSGAQLRWPRTDGAGSAGGGTGIDAGASGIAAFFLRLYEVTREPQWLEKAEGGARYVAAEYSAGRISSHEWLGGAAGGGDFLLEMYARTKRPEYLEGARAAGSWLLAAAIVDGDGVYWRHHPDNPNIYTGIAHGAAGSGVFLVRLYEATGDGRFLDRAERTFRWMRKHELRLGAAEALGWKRLTTDTTAYNGWCGGAVGNLAFFDALYQATGNAEYLAAWRATIEGLSVGASRRQETPLEVAWGYSPFASRSFPTVYCHGTSSTAAVLAEAALRTGDVRYAELAEAGGRWLDSVALPQRAGKTWQHIAGSTLLETGLLTGAASVGHASLRLYGLNRQPQHLLRAIEAAEYLLDIADHPAPGRTRWLNRMDSSSTPRYDTGWYSGGAGIGIFLLELHDALRGVMPGTRFSVINP